MIAALNWYWALVPHLSAVLTKKGPQNAVPRHGFCATELKATQYPQSSTRQGPLGCSLTKIHFQLE